MANCGSRRQYGRQSTDSALRAAVVDIGGTVTASLKRRNERYGTRLSQTRKSKSYGQRSTMNRRSGEKVMAVQSPEKFS